VSVRIKSVPAATERDWLTTIALGLLVAAFAAAAGPIGALAGIATVLVGAVLGLPYMLAVGHLALLACFPDGIDPLSVAGVEAAFVVVLLTSLRRTASPGRIGAVTIASALSLSTAAWLVVRSQSTWLAAGTVLGLLAGAAYGVHRLELVRLGLVPTGDDASAAEPELIDDRNT